MPRDPPLASSPAAIRGVTALRLALLPIIAIVRQTLSAPGGSAAAFYAVMAVAAAWALGIWFTGQRVVEQLPRVRTAQAAIDLVLVAGLAYTSGGAVSEIANLFAVVPIAIAFLAGPAATARVAAGAVGLFVLTAALRPAGQSVVEITAQTLFYAWPGALAVLISRNRATRTRELHSLTDDRQRLLREVDDVAQRERGRLAYALHDEALQSALMAQLRLPRAAVGETAAVEDVRAGLQQTVQLLRETITDLRIHALDGHGLSAGLRETAELLTRRTGVSITLHGDPTASAGQHDEVLFAIARELLTNATRHADARVVTLDLHADETHVHLSVQDDGIGLSPQRRAQALADGHIGLASCEERVEALGGRFTITAPRRGGLRVQVQIAKA